MRYGKAKVVVNITYPCYICGNEYHFARYVIDHIQNIHGYILNVRPIGVSRPVDNHYSFEINWNGTWDTQHFGCPSCWFHCLRNFEELMQHIMETHDPPRIAGFVHPVIDEEEYEIIESSEEEFHQTEDTNQSDDNEDDSKRKVKRDILNGLETINDIFKKLF